jgi:hypothetical protein
MAMGLFAAPIAVDDIGHRPPSVGLGEVSVRIVPEEAQYCVPPLDRHRPQRSASVTVQFGTKAVKSRVHVP